MLELSQRLIESALHWNIENYAPIFDQTAKSTRDSTKAVYRVGLWPIVSDSSPEVAMGIGLVLAALLEQRSSIRVYRLLAEVPDVSSGYDWSIEKSQFGVDDWELEGLDENVALWGTFEITDNYVELSVEVENDARDDDETLKLEYREASLVSLLNLIPTIVEEITIWINPMLLDGVGQYSQIFDTGVSLLKDFLGQLFQFEREYYLSLWNTTTASANLSVAGTLVDLTQQLNCDFGAWMLAQSMARILVFDDPEWSKSLALYINEKIDELGEYPIFVSIICMTLFRLDYGSEVFDLLESNLLSHPENSAVWNALAAIYNMLREDLSTIDVYQRAIEAKSATSSAYRRYGDLMVLLNNQQIHLKAGNRHVSPAGRPYIERYIFIEPEEESPNLREAVAAYRNAFERNLDDIEALTQLVICSIILQESDLWDYCRKLVERDLDGGITASIIDQLDDDDIPLMIEILQDMLSNTSHQIGVRINLARCYLAIEEFDKANDELAQISMDEISQQNRLLVARLSLVAQVADFDNRIAEISDIVNANGKISEDDVEFLENLIEKEHSFSEGYGLLAKAYISRNEQDAALEVLLDCQNDAPFDPETTALLAKVLWNEDQPELALAYLEKGLKQDRHNATLLALNGRFLFDNGEDDAAKEFLLLAEESDPVNTELVATRQYIANVLIASKKDLP